VPGGVVGHLTISPTLLLLLLLLLLSVAAGLT
jgi:hypothetical protein